MRRILTYNSLAFLVSAIIGLSLALFFFHRYYSPLVIKDFEALAIEEAGNPLSSCMLHYARLNPYTGQVTSLMYSQLVSSAANATPKLSECFRSYFTSYTLDFTLQFYPLILIASSVSLYLFLRRLSHVNYLQVVVARGASYYLKTVLSATLIVLAAYSPAMMYPLFTLSLAGVETSNLLVHAFASTLALLLSLQWDLLVFLVTGDPATAMVIGFLQFFWILIDPSTYSLVLNPGLKLMLALLAGTVDLATLAHFVTIYVATMAVLPFFAKKLIEMY